MRQRLLNDALAATLAALLCLLSVTAYAGVKKSDSGDSCTSEDRTINGRAAKCEICTANEVQHRWNDGEQLP